MSASGQVLGPILDDTPPAVIVVNFPMRDGAKFDWHTHDDHQIAWAPHGVLTVLTGDASFILPPTRALWIPVGLRHETRSTGDAILRSLYVRPDRCPLDWSDPTAVAVSPLLAELIGYLASPSLSPAARANAEALLTDLLLPVPMKTVDVTLPSGGPARTVADALLAEPADGSTLLEWGRRVGASERTLARAFVAETGLPFGRWRSLVRLRSAISRLAAGQQVARVAGDVGYETASAFVAAFRRETGVTPGAYFGRQRSGSA